ncbi:MAG: ABC transporter substrate-binding protein [Candidatus Thorarchaeota archaeon]
MWFGERKRFYASLIVFMILFMAGSPALAIDPIDFPSNLNVGPYVDKVVYKVIGDHTQALLSGEIEFGSEYPNYEEVVLLNEDPDISIFSTLRNGYGNILINCGKYPLNLSAFRRAFAFAFDKTRVKIEVMGGLSQEHDSVVPYANSWCIEDVMPYHYYTAEVEIGNQILNDAGFTIDPITGYRLAPDGSEFKVIMLAEMVRIPAGVCQIGVDALRALHVNAEMQNIDFKLLLARVNNHIDYDMVFYAPVFVGHEVDWLVSEFGSEFVDTRLKNPTNFQNDTFDSWCEQLLYNSSYEAVYEAAAAMQLILHENVPLVVAYENILHQPYRTDEYTGHISDLGRWIGSHWTLRKIHKIDGTSGGTVRVGWHYPTTFNIFTCWSAYEEDILINLWPTLYSRDPNMDPWPYLAEDMLMETHSENQAVQEGNTRFTVDIIQNATWSDDTPLTAKDVVFTFMYLRETGFLGNPKAVGLVDLVAAYSPTRYRAVLEFSTESYWHFSNIAYTRIIPEHIFNNVDGIGYEGWNTWNPVFNPAEPYITAGPFVLTDWEEGEFVELSANPSFYYFPEEVPPTSTPTNTDHDYSDTLVICGGIVGAAVVIFVGGPILLRKE